MNDDKGPIERELEEAFAVEPSPDFQARIRRRVAGIPVGPKRPLWFVPSVGLAAAAAMILAVISLRPQPAPPSATAVVQTTVIEPVAPVTVKPLVRVEPTASPTASMIRPTPKPRQPEVAIQRTPVTPAPADSINAAMKPIESAPLQKLELEISPLPEMVVLPMARLDTFSIEPFNLKAQEPGVNE